MALYQVIRVGAAPQLVALSPNGAHLYVTNALSSTVSVIETSTRTVIRSPITYGVLPCGVAVTPNGARVYVSNLRTGTVSVIDTATASRSAPGQWVWQLMERSRAHVIIGSTARYR